MLISGYCLSATRLGEPDVRPAHADRGRSTPAARIVAAVDVPVLVDIDTGLRQRVQRRADRARAGAASAPRAASSRTRCGRSAAATWRASASYRSRSISRSSRARARPAARDFWITARTDARAVRRLDEAIRRARAFAEHGASCVFVEAPESVDEMARVRAALPTGVPLVANMVEQGKTPAPLAPPSSRRPGYRLVLVPVAPLLAVDACAARALRDARARRRTARWRRSHDGVRRAERAASVSTRRYRRERDWLAVTLAADDAHRPPLRAAAARRPRRPTRSARTTSASRTPTGATLAGRLAGRSRGARRRPRRRRGAAPAVDAALPRRLPRGGTARRGHDRHQRSLPAYGDRPHPPAIRAKLLLAVDRLARRRLPRHRRAAAAGAAGLARGRVARAGRDPRRDARRSSTTSRRSRPPAARRPTIRVAIVVHERHDRRARRAPGTRIGTPLALAAIESRRHARRRAALHEAPRRRASRSRTSAPWRASRIQIGSMGCLDHARRRSTRARRARDDRARAPEHLGAFPTQAIMLLDHPDRTAPRPAVARRAMLLGGAPSSPAR